MKNQILNRFFIFIITILLSSCYNNDNWIIGKEYKDSKELIELNGYVSSGALILDKKNYLYSIELFSTIDEKLLLINKKVENGNFKVIDYLIVQSDQNQKWTFNTDSENYIFIYHVKGNRYVANYAWKIIQDKSGKWNINDITNNIMEYDEILNYANID